VGGQVTAAELARAYGWAGRLGSSGVFRRHGWPVIGGRQVGRDRGLGRGWRAGWRGESDVSSSQGVSPHAPPGREGIAG